MKLIPIFFSLFLLIPVGIAQAATDRNGNWYCNLARPDFEKSDYANSINEFNRISGNYFKSNPDATMLEKRDFLIKTGLEYIGNKAACLKEGHGINPNSVAMFSPEVQEVFSYNMDKLIEMALLL